MNINLDGSWYWTGAKGSDKNMQVMQLYSIVTYEDGGDVIRCEEEEAITSSQHLLTLLSPVLIVTPISVPYLHTQLHTQLHTKTKCWS